MMTNKNINDDTKSNMTDLHNDITFCTKCGAKYDICSDSDGNPQRRVCNNCDSVHYDSPKIIVLSLVEYAGRILLCKRGIKPKHGYWTLPGGYMERNETIEGAAERETKEETGVVAKNLQLYSLINCTGINQVYFVFRGSVNDPSTIVGEESLDVKFYTECDIPWESLSYKLMKKILDWYFDDKADGKFKFRTYQTNEICPD